MSDATITFDGTNWAFQYQRFSRTFATREEAVAYAENFSDETGESFLLRIEKVG